MQSVQTQSKLSQSDRLSGRFAFDREIDGATIATLVDVIRSRARRNRSVGTNSEVVSTARATESDPGVENTVPAPSDISPPIRSQSSHHETS